MKTLQIFLAAFLFLSFTINVAAQTKTEKITVSGNCGMCKKTIEKSAKEAGATFAAWDADAQELTVKYNSKSSNTAKIEKAVAAAGYDTKNIKTTEEAYNKLHGCCKYDRTDKAAATECCAGEKCADAKCMKDGKCMHDKSVCKDSDGTHKDCCKKADH